jgi:hypothetical protein
MKRKNYIIFIRHLKKIKDLVDFYEYIVDSRVCAIAIYLFIFNRMLTFYCFAISNRIHRALYL